MIARESKKTDRDYSTVYIDIWKQIFVIGDNVEFVHSQYSCNLTSQVST